MLALQFGGVYQSDHELTATVGQDEPLEKSTQRQLPPQIEEAISPADNLDLKTFVLQRAEPFAECCDVHQGITFLQ